MLSRGFRAAENAPRRAGFCNGDLGQERQARLEMLPDPACNVLASGILKPGDVVQVTMIQLFPKRLKRGADLGVQALERQEQDREIGRVRGRDVERLDLARLAAQDIQFGRGTPTPIVAVASKQKLI